MFVLKFILKPIPLATLFIFGLVAVGPNAALAKKVKGKGTVEILAASGKNEPAKKKTSTPADLGPGGLTAKCKAKFEEFEDWDEAFKAFALPDGAFIFATPPTSSASSKSVVSASTAATSSSTNAGSLRPCPKAASTTRMLRTNPANSSGSSDI